MNMIEKDLGILNTKSNVSYNISNVIDADNNLKIKSHLIISKLKEDFKNMFLCVEKVNFEIASMLNKLSFNQFKKLFNLSTTKRHTHYSPKTEYYKVKNYTDEIIKYNNNYEVKYAYAEGKKCGRLQSKNISLQRIYNGFRGLLCDGLMYDIDMTNCAPCIILNLCKLHNIKYNYLLDYINNREEILQNTINEYNITRTQAKNAFICSINKIEYTQTLNNKKIKKNSFIHKFDIELSKIAQKLFNVRWIYD